MLAALFAAPAEAASPYLAPAGACANADDPAATPAAKLRAMRCLVNWARRRRGVARLRASASLDRSSQLRAVAIRRCGQFSHSACGQSFAAVFARVGYLGGTAAVGENLAWGGGPLGSPRSTFEAWLSSPSHRTNLLRPGWRDLGVSVVRASHLFGQQNVTVWVAQFGRRG